MNLTRPLAKRYCEMCDKWVAVRAYECPDCGADTVRALPEQATSSDAVDPQVTDTGKLSTRDESSSDPSIASERVGE